MAAENVQQRLKAILAADVVGYSGKMEADEAGTHAAVTSHISEVFEPEIGAHHGRIFKTMGDAVFAEFESVVNAVQCAMAVQKGMRERNSEIPEERRIDFRIGVNLGDVILQDDDVWGDGVNVAQRLEGLAKPGGICISHAVYEVVRKRKGLNVDFMDLGPQRVKNMMPVHAYQLETIPTPRSSLGLDRPVIGFVDDDPMEVEVFQRVFGDQYQVFASTRSISDIEKQMEAVGVSPSLMILDLYFPSGREATESERIEMFRLKQKVEDAQQTLTAYLSSIGQGREGGLQLLEVVQQKFPGLPVTFYTRKGTIDDVVACLDAGALHVLKKPQPSSIDGNIAEHMEDAARASKQFLSSQFDRLLSLKGPYKKAKKGQ